MKEFVSLTIVVVEIRKDTFSVTVSMFVKRKNDLPKTWIF